MSLICASASLHSYDISGPILATSVYIRLLRARFPVALCVSDFSSSSQLWYTHNTLNADACLSHGPQPFRVRILPLCVHVVQNVEEKLAKPQPI